MNDRDYWNDSRTLKLINTIKKYPAIWKKASPDYFNRVQKNISWNRIAAEMEFPLALVKQKYQRLCQMYYSEGHKKRRSANYTITWKFFVELDLLIGGNSKRRLVKVSSSTGENDIWLDDSDESDLSVAEEENVVKQLWNDKNIKKFIEILQRNPVLLDLSSNSPVNEKAWKKVAEKLNCSVSQAKLQKKSLIILFRYEHKKSLENPNFKSNWKYFEALQFLADLDHSSLQATDATKQPTVAATTNDAMEDEVILCENEDDNDTAVKRVHLLDEHWNSKNILELIDLVRSRPVIWDENNAYNSNEAKQNEAWIEIAEQKNLTLKTLKNKFHSLIKTYNLECQQIAKDPLYVTGWFYFPYMKFLPQAKETITLDSFSNIIDLADHEKERTTEFPTKINKQLDTLTKEMQEPNLKKHQAKERDEYTIFGEAVANEMRLMSDFKSIQTSFKNKVLKILLSAREGSSQL